MNLHAVRPGDTVHEDILGLLVYGSDGTYAQPLVVGSDGGLIVEVTGSVTVSGTVDTELPAAVAHNDGLTLAEAPNIIAASYARTTNATTWDRVSCERADNAGTGITGDRGMHTSEIPKYQEANFLGVSGAYTSANYTRTSTETQSNRRFRRVTLFLAAWRTGWPGAPLVVQAQYRTGGQWHDYRGPGGRMEFTTEEIIATASASRNYLSWDLAIGGDAHRIVVSTEPRGVRGSNFYTIEATTPYAVGTQKN